MFEQKYRIDMNNEPIYKKMTDGNVMSILKVGHDSLMEKRSSKCSGQVLRFHVSLPSAICFSENGFKYWLDLIFLIYL